MEYESNPYAPPAASSEPLPVERMDGDPLPLYPVSILKLVILSTITLGLYDIYWMYKQWKAIRDHVNWNVSPFLRSFFGVWFSYSLFDRVRQQARTAGLPGNVPAGALAAAFIVFTILGQIGSRIDNDVLWVMSLLTVVPLVIVQQTINRIVRHHDRHADMNTRFTAGNIITILVGASIWLLVIFGMTTD